LAWIPKGPQEKKKKRGVGQGVGDGVDDVLEAGCCLGDLLSCSTIALAALAVVGAGVFAGARRLKL
jgi:hypothetical protein